MTVNLLCIGAPLLLSILMCGRSIYTFGCEFFKREQTFMTMRHYVNAEAN